jgi:hypothetical protein
LFTLLLLLPLHLLLLQLLPEVLQRWQCCSLCFCCCWHEAFEATPLLLLLCIAAAAASCLRAAVAATAQHCSCYCPVWTATNSRRRCSRLLLLLLLQLLVHSCHPRSAFLFWYSPQQCMEVVL